MERPGQRNFLGLPETHSSEETSLFHVVPVPYDATSTYVPGSRMGPRAIIDASANLELYDHELDLEPARVGIATHHELPVFVGDPLRMLAQIRESVERILSDGRFPIVIGGEHTVSLGAVEALASRGRFMLVCLDAHGDLRDAYQGTGYSHACYLRRASEIVDCCSFGVRSISREEAAYAKGAGIRIIYADALLRTGVDDVDLDFVPEDIYISIDLDVFDPSIMPAVGTPEPGGIGWYDMVSFLKRIITGRRILGFDVVELCPQPGNLAPDFSAAKLIFRLMGIILKLSKNKRQDWMGYGKEKIQEEATS